jgi:hypothetical protein
METSLPKQRCFTMGYQKLAVGGAGTMAANHRSDGRVRPFSAARTHRSLWAATKKGLLG